MGTTVPVLSSRAKVMRLVAVMVAFALAGFISPGLPRAHAVPAQDWLELSLLQTRLAAAPGGALDGYFKTVVGGPTGGDPNNPADPQDPKTLPLTVLGVIPDAGMAGPLILVRLDLSDPTMAKIGNIASGMSGSPVYLEDPTGDKLVGALSYGDIFTTDGLALATPIDDMMKVESYGLTPPAAVAVQETPRKIPAVKVNGRTISKIALARPDGSTDASAAAAASDTAYFKPLLGMQIGGLPVTSPAYKRLASAAAKRGLAVLPPHGTGARGSALSFRTEVVPGAAAGEFLSVGDLSAGAIGTVTYTTAAGGVLAFGHPLLWNGRTAAFFTNAWIDGVWSSTLGSYKLGSPGSVRGTLVQDRAAAVAARVEDGPNPGPTPTEVRSTANVTVDGTTRPSDVGVTQVAPVTFATEMRSDLVAAAVLNPVYRAADILTMPGSATTDLRVVVNDGKRDYEIRRANLFDDDYDVQGAPAAEIYTVLETLLENPEGMTPVTIKSVAVTTNVNSARKSATITGISSTGLRTGANSIRVAVRPYGKTATVPIDVTLTIPPGTPLTGTVSAGIAADDDDEEEEPEDVEGGAVGTIAERVAQLRGGPRNSHLTVSFTPEDSERSFTGFKDTAYVIKGYQEAATSATSVEASESTIVAGQTVILDGSVRPARAGDKVKVERRTVGSSTWQTLRGTLALQVEEGEGSFQLADKPVNNSVYRVTYAGSKGILGSSASVGVTVRGRVSLTGTPTKTGFVLTSTLAPKAAGATITFQWLKSGQWRTIRAVKTNSAGVARFAWTAQKGSYRVRAVLPWTTPLAGNVSPTVAIRR